MSRKGAYVSTPSRSDARPKIQGWLCDRRFDHLQGSFALWTSQAVRDLIALRFGKTLGLSTVQPAAARVGQRPQELVIARAPH